MSKTPMKQKSMTQGHSPEISTAEEYHSADALKDASLSIKIV